MSTEIVMKAKVRRWIEELASRVRQFIGINNFTVIDEVKAIEALGGVIIYDMPISEQKSAYIRHIATDNEGSFEIHLPELKERSERRWLIFRLLGHLFLDMGYEIDDDRWGAADIFELPDANSIESIEACEFARDIMMPRYDYFRIWKRCKVTETIDGEERRDISPIMFHFAVPEHVATAQGRRLGIITDW